MDEKLKEFEVYREEVCKKANKMMCIGSVLLVVGMLGVFATMIPLFIILIIPGGILLAIASSKKSKISKEFKLKFVPALVKDLYPDANYDPHNGLTEGQILEPGFFKRPDRFYSEDLVRATYNGIPFELCDFDLKERHVHHNSKGGTTVTYETYAKGRFMTFDFKREFNQIVKVAETKYLGLNTRGLEKVDTESMDFNKKFNTYASDPVTAFYVLTPQVQLKLLELESKFKGSIFFAFMKGKFYVAICDNVSILDVNASKKISQETLDILISQLSVPASVINELNLDKSKYNDGDAI